MAGDRGPYPGSQDSLLVSVIQTRHILSLPVHKDTECPQKLDVCFKVIIIITNLKFKGKLTIFFLIET